VWGRGIAERDLLYVDDAVTGILLIVERSPDAGLINVGRGHGIRVHEIAETVCEAVGYRGTIRFDASRPEGPLKKTLDITKLQATLGWTPPTTLANGVRQTLTWLESHTLEVLA
jgi:GDP-L-fucose synthase